MILDWYCHFGSMILKLMKDFNSKTDSEIIIDEVLDIYKNKDNLNF